MRLQEAVMKCRGTGGRFRRHDVEVWNYLDNNGHVRNEEGNLLSSFLAYDFATKWIYEPPKESAFEKWDAEHYKATWTINEIEAGRKNHLKGGWIAAVDEVIGMMFNENTERKLKELKELKEA